MRTNKTISMSPKFLSIVLLAASLTESFAGNSLRVHAQAGENYLLQKTYKDATCVNLLSGSTTRADLCFRTNSGKYLKVLSVAANATSTYYSDAACTTVTSTTTTPLLGSCSLISSGVYGMSSFTTAPTFQSQEAGVSIR